MGFSHEQITGSLRLTLGILNTEQEIQQKLREERDERQNQANLLAQEAADLRAALQQGQADVAARQMAVLAEACTACHKTHRNR